MPVHGEELPLGIGQGNVEAAHSHVWAGSITRNSTQNQGCVPDSRSLLDIALQTRVFVPRLWRLWRCRALR